jgi:hypothetical protein
MTNAFLKCISRVDSAAQANKCQFQAISLKVVRPNISQLHIAVPFHRSYYLLNYSMNYQHIIECKRSLAITTRHWPLSWARLLHSLFPSLSIQNTQHQNTFTFSEDNCHLQIHLCTAHYFIWWRLTKSNTHYRTMMQDHFWWCGSSQHVVTFKEELCWCKVIEDWI